MIGLGVRLTVSGGREAVTRLLILTAAVGLGVGLLLAAVSAVNAVGVQNAMRGWTPGRRTFCGPPRGGGTVFR
jgi:hypothetical protein